MEKKKEPKGLSPFISGLIITLAIVVIVGACFTWNKLQYRKADDHKAQVLKMMGIPEAK